MFIDRQIQSEADVPFRLSLALLALSIALIAGFWWWMGRPIDMPPSPLAENAKVPCVSYAPFRRGQSPFTETIVIPKEQIDDDFARLSKITDCVRLYAVDQGLQVVPELARKHGLQVMLGIWIGRKDIDNRKQIETAVDLTNAYKDVVKLLIIGNEVLLRGEQSEENLGKILREVKSRVSVPTTYADVWEFWLRHKALANDVDIVTVHILPYWEDEPVAAELAGAHIDEIRAHVGEEFPGKRILIGETGWPSEGRSRWESRSTPAAQARVLHDILAFEKKSGVEVNLIEAFDQPWKRLLEGTAGGYWGLLDADSREPKFQWGEPISNHPGWIWQAAIGCALSILIFAAAGWRLSETRSWLAVAAIATVAGGALGLTVHMQAVGARSTFELVRSILYLAVAAGVPVLAAAAIGRGVGAARLEQVFGPGRATGFQRSLTLAVAATAVLATYFALGLAFDARYRQFEYATLVGPAASLLLVSLLAPREAGLSERMFALILTACAVAIVIEERIVNLDAVALSVVLLILAGALWLGRVVQTRAATAPVPAR